MIQKGVKGLDSSKSRTDPRIIRTRQLIREALVELLEEMDIEKLSVNRIAERATINRVTFYLHYRDIPDMLEKIAEEMAEDIRSIIHQPVGVENASGGEEDWPVIVSLLEHIAANVKFYKVILTTRRTPVFTDRLMRLLAEMISARLEITQESASIAAAGIQKDIAVWYGSAALIGTIVAWLRTGMRYTPQYLAKQFTLLRSFHHPSIT
jgi:AcrR family transcriptional regulator